MNQKNYPKILAFLKWSSLVSFVIFFIVVNIAIFFIFKNSPTNYKRLHSPTSYGEIKNKIEAVKRDKNKKIIFLGASSMWGAPGITDAEDTIPFQFARHIAGGVSVYNFSFPSAHPLDVLIITTLLKDQADLFVIDINSDYLKADAVAGAKEDRKKYLRVHRLLSANYRNVFKESSAVEGCLSQYELREPYEIFIDIAPHIPLLKYKDEINYALFGKPFPLFFSNVLNGALELFKSGQKQVVWRDIFKPKEDFPVNNINIHEGKVEELKPSINSCVSQALAGYIAATNIPAIFYLTPRSPEVTKLQRPQAEYGKNKKFILGLYKNANIIDLDAAQAVASSNFIDEIHFNKTGHKQVAESLVNFIKTANGYKELVK
ncbi:MAG: hypothetical protein HYT15_02675 [Candidatus Magasanikbacteria bacterium]|nr:hypothetical protein [Candidatus Magasanikbacteria bacterium]